MKKFGFLCLVFLFLCGCANKHPYNFLINENIVAPDKSTSVWIIYEIENSSHLSMLPEKKARLTSQISNFLKNKGFNTSKLNPDEEKNCDNCFVVKPRIIQTMAEISQNMAGWHGTTEDPLNFWSHFSPGRVRQTVHGSAEALSLYVAIFSGDKKYFENAGGIELVGKYNKFSFQTTKNKEAVLDNEKFINAMDIAFEPLIEVVK